MFRLRVPGSPVLAVMVICALAAGGCAAAAHAAVPDEAPRATPTAIRIPTQMPTVAVRAAITAAPGSNGTRPVVTGLQPPTPTPLASGSTEPVMGARTITVVGHGETKVRPDIARTAIGIEITAPTVGEATRIAQTQMENVLKALRAAGIAEKDMQTSNFSINFERQGSDAGGLLVPINPSGTPATPGSPSSGGVYHVNNMVSVTIRDLDRVGAVIDAAVNAGANNVWGITFGLEDTGSLEEEARGKAVADAQARAARLAQLNGVKVGEVLAISEVIGQTPVRAAAVNAPSLVSSGITPVQNGEVTFSTDIQITYELK